MRSLGGSVGWLAGLSLALWALGCSSTDGSRDAGQDGEADGSLDGQDGVDGDQDDGGPVCLHPGIYPEPVTFTEVTQELGLGPDGLRMTGILALVVDLDGDRWPDLALTKSSSAREDPAAPHGYYRLLHNLGGTGFEDWTWRSGLFRARDGTEGRATSLLLFGDVDNDGDQDAFAGVYQNYDNAATLVDRSAVFLNQGDGMFAIAPEQAFTLAEYEPVSSATFLDADHDGYLDLFTSEWYGRYGYLESMTQDYLWRGQGDGAFVDMTAAAGLTTVPFDEDTAADGKFHRASWGATACDLDDDGWDDLLIAAYGRSWNQLYRNTGAGVFEDLTIGSGYEADGNQSFREDDQFFLCYCQSRRDQPYCEGAGAPALMCAGMENNWWPGVNDQPWDLGGNSGTTACGDVDNDGDLDLLTSEIAHWHIGQASDKSELLLNVGFPAAPFLRPGNEATGLTRVHADGWNEGDMGAALADLDNDGRMDAMIPSSDYPDTYFLLWQQGSGGTFRELGQQAGVRVHRSRGLGLVDYDRDGDYD
ncbi:MAG TPA: VCBS repeat-containing protein, partial [Myxococcota bacterium]|nr:VCBS repeat-containing protein [Myxococcota bacterium]